LKTISISGVIGWDFTEIDMRRLLADAKGEDVEIEISSPGGFVYSGLAIYNLIKNYSGKTTSKLIGLAASMASYIALAADYVKAEKNSVYMIHNALVCTCGNHNDLRKSADVLEGLSKITAQAYAEKTGKTIDEIRQMMDDETYLFGEEIKEAGFVDEIIESKDKKDKRMALAIAEKEIKSCANTMREVNEDNSDMEKAVALIGDINKPTQKKPEDSNMSESLQELLDKNPEAKAEYEKAMAEKKVEAPENNVSGENGHIKFAKQYLANEKYPQSTLRALAADVISGDADVVQLKSVISYIDTQAEMKKSDAAADESGKTGDTPAEELEKEDLKEKQIESAMLADVGVNNE
jgi:ATP-dependent Clp endopeptidase proteolytic subunit ClpP